MRCAGSSAAWCAACTPGSPTGLVRRVRIVCAPLPACTHHPTARKRAVACTVGISYVVFRSTATKQFKRKGSEKGSMGFSEVYRVSVALYSYMAFSNCLKLLEATHIKQLPLFPEYNRPLVLHCNPKKAGRSRRRSAGLATFGPSSHTHAAARQTSPGLSVESTDRGLGGESRAHLRC